MSKRIIKAVEADKVLMKRISNITCYSVEAFIDDGKRWISAIKTNRMVCNIDTVSKSGMSRTMKFMAMTKNKSGYYKSYSLLNFYSFSKASGLSIASRNSDYFRVHGCGMDMVFATNYNIIRSLYHYNFITLKTCRKLEQQTPDCI